MKYFQYLMMASLVVGILACQVNDSADKRTPQYQDSVQKETEKSGLPVQPPVDVEWIDLKYLKLTPEMGLAYDSVKMEDHCSTFRVKFLYAKSGPDASKINTAIYQQPDRNGIRKNLSSDGKKFLESAFADLAENGDTNHPDFPFCYDENSDDDLVFWNKRYLCIENNVSQYLGGAHGMYGAHYVTVDISNGTAVDLRTWIQDSTRLLNIARTLLKKYPEGGGSGSEDPETLNMTLEDLGYFVEGDGLPMPYTIGVCPEGVIFYYGPYEINAYAAGAYTLVLPWGAVGNAFRQDFLKP